MKKLFKNTALILLCTAVIFSVSACALKKEGNVSSDPGSSEENSAVQSGASDASSENGGEIILPDPVDVPGFTALKSSEYYCYNRLNDKQKKAYGIIYKMVSEYSLSEQKIDGVNDGDAALAYYAVRADNPQLFWMSNEYAVGMSNDKSYTVVSLSGDGYGFITSSKEERDSKAAELENAVNEVISSVIKKGMSKFEAEIAVHDWICENVIYNKAAAADPDKSDMSVLTAYGALVEKSAVCEGYARAFQLIMYRLGINCTVILGTADKTTHMWNAVRLDDGWYYTDVTWDDNPKSGLEYTHFNFNVSEELISKTHKKNADASEIKSGEDIKKGTFNLFCEPCVFHTYNYYTVNNLVVADTDSFGATVLPALKGAWDGKIAAAEFRYEGREATTAVLRNDCSRWGILNEMTDYTGKADGVLGYTVGGGYGCFAVKFN